MSKPTKKQLAAHREKIADEGASFDHMCPNCGEDDSLYVQSGEFYAQGMKLGGDGFSFSDAKNVDTEDESVKCGSCDHEFPLSEATL